MPKKEPGPTPEEQSRKFVEDAQSMIDAGELNPTDAEKRMGDALKPAQKAGTKGG